MAALQALSVASEVFPIVKTGGLADVAGALPKALAPEGVAVTTMLPGYPAVIAALDGARTVLAVRDLFGGDARIVAGRAAGLDAFVLDAPHLYAREGNPYLAPGGDDWPDNAYRFAAFARMAAAVAQGAIERYRPDVVHAHDWQAALAPAYLRYSGRAHPPSIVTIHNLAFQGNFPLSLRPSLGLPPEADGIDGAEFFGNLSFLKAGLQYADRITTVSPTYALEILTTEGGMGFEGILRARGPALGGILNGIDVDVWNPATDSLIDAAFDAGTPDARAANTTALQQRLGLEPDPAAFVLGIVSRFSEQKGLDLVLEALPQLLEGGAQLAVVGTGDVGLERAFEEAARRFAGRVGCAVGYDEALAHRVQAGATALLVPSRFEPCGLTQLCALRYGAVPIVARVGGLADTVIDANEMALEAGVATGFQFSPPQATMLAGGVARAVAAFEDADLWRRIRANGMNADVSWRRPAQRYARLYRSLATGTATRRARA